MFNLPHKPTTNSPPDFTQMLILCSLALIIGLCIPVRGSFVVIAQIFIDIFQTGNIQISLLLAPIIAILITIISFSSFHYRKRWYGFITSLGSIYVFFIINNYVREQSWNKEDTPGIGGTIIFVSSIFLIAISFLYSIRPGKKPQHVFWWRPEPKSNRLIRLSAVVFGSGIICTQNNLPIIGYGLAFTRFTIAYYAHKLK